MSRPTATDPATRLDEIARRLSALPSDKQDAFVGWLAQRGISVLGLPIVAQPRPAALPLSSAQRRLWLLDKLHPDSALYNVPRVFALAGELDAAALARALEVLVERHEALRTTFVEQDGEPAQVVGPPPRIALEPIDLAQLPEPERLPRARALADAEAHRPFDLGRGPVFRATLVRVTGGLHWLLLTSHHIVMDEWSDEIVARELVELYDALHRGRPPELASLPLQYADYAVWQRRWHSEQQLASELAYWKARLGGDEYVLTLPGDFAPAAATGAGASFDFRLDRALTERLRSLGTRHNTTLFATLLAVFHVLLHRYTGQREIRVGSPIANRHRREIEGVIGCFANTQVLTSAVRGAVTFSQYLDEVRQTVIEAQANQDLPFERLVEVLQPERRASHTPLFQVMSRGHRGLADVAPAGGALTITQERVDDRGAKFDLVLHMTDDEAGVGGELLYRAERFAPRTMATMAERFARLCAEVADYPERRIAELAWLGDAERAQIVGAWNATEARRSFVGLHQLIEAHARSQPDAPAVAAEAEQLGSAALDRRAARLARLLALRGVGPEGRVGLGVPRSIDMVVAMLGILKAGAAYVPLDARAPGERLREMLVDGGIALVVAHAEVAARFAELGADVVDLGELENLDERGDLGDRVLIAVRCTTSASPSVAVARPPASPSRARPPRTCSTPRAPPAGPRAWSSAIGAITSYAQGLLERLALPPGASMRDGLDVDRAISSTPLAGALVAGGLLHVVDEDADSIPTALAEYVVRQRDRLPEDHPVHLGSAARRAADRSAARSARR